jgi:tetratricopeptide (TPR) repeat protein
MANNKMKKWIAAVLALTISSFSHATSQEKTYKDVSHVEGSICNVKPQAKCWKPLADLLTQLGTPSTEREREDQLSGYWMLAKSAHLVGDFSDSKEFYGIALNLAKGVKPDAKNGVDQIAASMMIKSDAAALALSMHDYSTALSYLDEFSAFSRKAFGRESDSDSISLLHCAALIGLKRTTEADKGLQEILQGLNFEGQSPWEDFPFGPQPLDPNQTARRIAAHYMRENNYEQALLVLQMVESKRLKTMSIVPKEPVRGAYWASLLNPADILDDEAAVYIGLGRDDQAEPLLIQSLQIREKKANRQLQHLLVTLGALRKRAGRQAEAIDFANRAAAVKMDEDPMWTDPLESTLGFAD